MWKVGKLGLTGEATGEDAAVDEVDLDFRNRFKSWKIPCEVRRPVDVVVVGVVGVAGAVAGVMLATTVFTVGLGAADRVDFRRRNNEEARLTILEVVGREG